MHLKIFVSLLFLASLSYAEGAFKTVYHCDYDDDERFNVFMSTLLHQIEHYEEELIENEISIVVNGFCTRYISKESKDGKFLAMLDSRIQNYGVKVYACQSGMKASGVKQSDIKGVQLVPNGGAKLAELQNQGFAYIKVW